MVQSDAPLTLTNTTLTLRSWIKDFIGNRPRPITMILIAVVADLIVAVNMLVND